MGFFKTITTGYKIMGQDASNFISKNRAQIASGVSIVGTIVSNVLSTRAGAKSARSIDAKAVELGRPLTTKEKVQLCWTNHIVPGATAVGSCVSAVYSNNQHVKNFNRAATAYAGIKKLYDSAQKATREVLGEKKSAELQDKVNQKYIEEHPEVKKKMIEAGPNPDPSTMRKFWEPISGEVFYSTIDKIELVIKEMNSEMALMKPRKGDSLISNEEKCIKLSRFFQLMDIEIPKSKKESEVMRYYAFLKGSEPDGSDDDKISAYYTPMMLDSSTMDTCAAINWETKPSDCRYGNYLKV